MSVLGYRQLLVLGLTELCGKEAFERVRHVRRCGQMIAPRRGADAVVVDIASIITTIDDVRGCACEERHWRSWMEILAMCKTPPSVMERSVSTSRDVRSIIISGEYQKACISSEVLAILNARALCDRQDPCLAKK